MNVLTIIDTLSISGLGRVASRSAESFVKFGHESTILVLHKDIGLEIDSAVNLVPLKLGQKINRKKYLQIIRNKIAELTASGVSFDLILVHGVNSIKVMKSYQHKNIYFYMHNTLSLDMTKNYSFIKGWLKKIKAKRLYSGLNVICVSNGVMEDALKKMKIRPKSIRVIYNGIDKNEIWRKSLEHNPYKDEDYIVNISRLDPEKRHDILIDAFVKSGLSCKLLLIGEGREQAKYEKYVINRGLSNQILFLGKIENPMPILKDAKFLVHTADFEGFPLVLLEALILNTPVISRNCPSGPNEILTQELTENLIPMDDFERLVERMKMQFKEQKKDLEKHVQKISFKTIVPQYERLVEECEK